MAKLRRKRRTREHIITDLSVHHVEGHVLRCGWVVERRLAEDRRGSSLAYVIESTPTCRQLSINAFADRFSLRRGNT